MDTDVPRRRHCRAAGRDQPQRADSINLHAPTGTVNVALLRTFDRDVTADGKVSFEVHGRRPASKSPELTGNVDFEKVDLALDGIPNGLSNLNGRLVFNPRIVWKCRV